MEGPCGAGKSTLAESIANRLGAHNQSVDFIPSDAIFERAEFVDVPHAVRTNRSTRVPSATKSRLRRDDGISSTHTWPQDGTWSPSTPSQVPMKSSGRR